MATTNGIRRSIGSAWMIAAAALVAPAAGCTSAISTAYLRDGFWELADHSEEKQKPADDEATPDSWDSSATAADAATEAVDAERRAAAIEEAVARLSKLGSLDVAARATLVETLQRTQQEDWPAVVDAFASTLEEAAAEARAAEEVVNRGAPPVLPASHVVAKADLDRGELPSEPVLDGEPEPVSPPAAVVVAEMPAAPEPDPAVPATVEPAEAEPAPVSPALSIRNACFASKVQGWGVVERFPDDQFRGGQEVIVYFELDNLSAGESPAGHTTCIDTTLSLVDGSGRAIQQWSFEPIAETCVAKRRDYFARYVIRLPDAVAADCRIAVDVVDTLAGTSAQASLPLRIAAAD
ncbi:MAG: hypothetical protein ACKOC8_02440 [Pirellulales bacterium]